MILPFNCYVVFRNGDCPLCSLCSQDRVGHLAPETFEYLTFVLFVEHRLCLLQSICTLVISGLSPYEWHLEFCVHGTLSMHAVNKFTQLKVINPSATTCYFVLHIYVTLWPFDFLTWTLQYELHAKYRTLGLYMYGIPNLNVLQFYTDLQIVYLRRKTLRHQV